MRAHECVCVCVGGGEGGGVGRWGSVSVSTRKDSVLARLSLGFDPTASCEL